MNASSLVNKWKIMLVDLIEKEGVFLFVGFLFDIMSFKINSLKT